MRILFLVPYPTNEAPSQRFRFEQYLDYLSQNGYTFTIRPFYSSSALSNLYQAGNLIPKLLSVCAGILCRSIDLFRLNGYAFIFIHRECAPVGPPFFEWLITHVWRKKIVYDFDDAIWLTDKLKESALETFIRSRGKVASICKWSHVVSCGNRYLAAFALEFNSNVVVLPTTIDVTRVHNPELFKVHQEKPVSIGWTGSHSTLKYLTLLLPVLTRLQDDFPELQLVVIADREPVLPLRNVIYRKWSIQTEIEDLAAIDIGIMPLPDDEWSKGKCGFKALQYMAMEIPAVISAVGVNTEIVDNGVDGYLCTSSEEWYSALRQLIIDRELRRKMGLHGRAKVIQRYSSLANSAKFLSLFQ